MIDVSFLCAKTAGKEETKKNDRKRNVKVSEYDMDGCYCLLIAIVNGVGACAARRLYDNGPRNLGAVNPLPRGRLPDQAVRLERSERNKRICTLRKEGYSLEAISDLLGCDSSTVKRNLKRKEA